MTTNSIRFAIGAEHTVREAGKLAPDPHTLSHAVRDDRFTLCGVLWRSETTFSDADWTEVHHLTKCPDCRVEYDKIVDEEANRLTR